MNKKNNNNKIAVIFIFMSMFLVAMYDNVRGPFVPSIKNEFNISNTGIATTLLMCSLGYIISTYLGGILCEKVGQKKVFILGFIFMIFSATGLYFSNGFTIYMIELFSLNVGQALISIGTNTIIPIIGIGFQAVLMNLTHFFYGIGATFTQRFSGIMIYKGFSWREIYMIIAIISTVIFLGFIFIKIPEVNTSKKSSSINYKEIFTNKLVYFYMIALGFYVSAELNTGNWFVNFMNDTYKYNENKASFYTALFFGVFTVGRLLGGFFAEKLGYLKSVLFSVTMAFLMYTLGLIMGEKGIVIVSISGLFFAIIFPTIVLSINNVFKKNASYITATIITIASFTSMLVNVLIGTLNDYIGVYKSYYIIPICLFISMVFTYLIYVNTKKMVYSGREKND